LIINPLIRSPDSIILLKAANDPVPSQIVPQADT
jgi:hypothetical protein